MDRSSAKTTAGRTRGGPNTPDVFYSQSNSSYGPRARGRDGDQGRGQSQPSQPPRAPLSSPSSTSFSFPSSRRHRNEQINGPLPPTPSSNPIPAKPPRLSPGLSPTSPIPFDQRSPNRSFDRLDSNESFESILPGKAAAAAYREVPDEYPLTHYSSERDGPDMERAGVRQPRVRRDFRRDTRELPDPVPQKPAARSGGGGARSYLREKYETHFKISRHTPFFCYLITLIQILVFIAELAVNSKCRILS